MTNIDFENYFSISENNYCDAKIIITILEDIIGKPIDEIIKDINKKKVNVTSGQIKDYLERKFTEENSELKERIRKPRKNKNRKSVTNFDEENIQALETIEFMDNLNALRYHFEPYTLEYFSKYTDIMKQKINSLLNIIKHIGIKETVSIQDTLTDLDIILDQNGNILKKDIIRLIMHTIYNIDELDHKLSQANDLSTYLNFKMSELSLARDDISENEIYPPKTLQVKDLYGNFNKGNIPLSDHQKDELHKQLRKSMQKTASSLLG